MFLGLSRSLSVVSSQENPSSCSYEILILQRSTRMRLIRRVASNLLFRILTWNDPS